MARKKAETAEVKAPKKKTAKKETEQKKEAPVVERKLRMKNAPQKEPEAEAVEAELVTETAGVGGNGNLIPLNRRTKEEQREICSKGGVASVRTRRMKKELRELTKDFLMQEANATLRANMKVLGVEKDDMSNLAAMMSRLFNKAVNQGDLNAARTLIEWAGMAPLQEMQENAAIAKMSQVMQLAGVTDGEENEDVEDVVFYIPDNQRPIITDDDLVTVGEEA